MNGEPDLYVGGQWRHASDGGTRDIVNPADGSVTAVVDEATDADARAAVSAARAAFDDGGWPATPVAERADLLMRVADLLQRGKEDLALLETRDTGKTLAESRIDIDDVTSVFRYYGRLVGVEADRVIDVG
ncbi:MAG: betaine-aldehyde dehydrogenase, partial [Mycobacterium sp.]|nr:betaine-aldehyde dehydrogenase [Mycobacterium sp.]